MNYVHPRVWLFVMVIFSIIFVLNLQFKNSIRKYVFSQKISSIFDSQARNEGDVKVVLLCSSLGKQGLSDSHILNQLMEEFDSSKFEFVKISIDAASLEDFTDNQLLYNKLIEYEPDYIILQESYLFIDRIRMLRFYSIRHTIGIRQLYELFQRSKSSKRMIVENTKTNEIYVDSLKNQSHFLMGRNKIRESPTLHNFTKNIGATILVTELPLPRHFEDVMDSTRQTQSYQKIFAEEKNKTDFIYLKYPRSHPFSHYYDESHMNDVGEQIFTRWLLHKISEIHKGIYQTTE